MGKDGKIAINQNVEMEKRNQNVEMEKRNQKSKIY